MFQILKNEVFVGDKPLVYGFFKDEENVNVPKEIKKDVEQLFKDKEISDSLGSINKIHTLGKLENKVVYLVSLGLSSEYSLVNLENALKGVNYKLGKELNIVVDSFVGKLDKSEVLKILVQSINHYNYVYDELLSKKIDNDLTLNLISKDLEKYAKKIEEGFNIATAMNNVKDLVNKPYNYLNALDLEQYAKDLVEELDNDKVKIKVYNKKEIEKLEMTSFLGVNQGSTAEPRLIHITYNGGEGEYLGLVGKGVMFDTGGYSLKTNMLDMKNDMAGSATVLGVLEAVVKNNLKINLQIIIAATDNRVSGNAFLPDDVLTAMNKMTIEIKSTDAEGRLTLADALTFAQKEGCKELIDVATLTGAVVVALGEDVTGLFGNNDMLVADFLKAAKETNEEAWHMPITEGIRKAVRSSKVADLTNSTGRYMGASSAAAFLEAFVEKDINWLHLDIAGTAFSTSPKAGNFYGATAAMVKSIYRYIENK